MMQRLRKQFGSSLECWVQSGLVTNNSTPLYLSKIIKNRHLYGSVHSGIIHNRRKVENPKCISTHERINKMCSIYTIDHYSALKKKKEILIHATSINF